MGSQRQIHFYLWTNVVEWVTCKMRKYHILTRRSVVMKECSWNAIWSLSFTYIWLVEVSGEEWLFLAVVILSVELLEVIQLLLLWLLMWFILRLIGRRDSICWSRSWCCRVPEESLLRRSTSHLDWIIALDITCASDLWILTNREALSINTASESWEILIINY